MSKAVMPLDLQKVALQVDVLAVAVVALIARADPEAKQLATERVARLLDQHLSSQYEDPALQHARRYAAALGLAPPEPESTSPRPAG